MAPASLFRRNNSLFCWVGNILRKACNNNGICGLAGSPGANLGKFAVLFPNTREFGTGDRFDIDCIHHQIFQTLGRRAERTDGARFTAPFTVLFAFRASSPQVRRASRRGRNRVVETSSKTSRLEDDARKPVNAKLAVFNDWPSTLHFGSGCLRNEFTWWK